MYRSPVALDAIGLTEWPYRGNGGRDTEPQEGVVREGFDESVEDNEDEGRRVR